jgi:glycosyltransferase involved in cell wall biosynthesis
MLKQITPLILTYNEGPNIQQTLDRLTWADDIVVVDSFSNDNTLEIVSRYKQARVLKRKFSTFSEQCNFGLEQGLINTEWVLNLDADYVLTDEFVEELRSLNPDSSVDAYQARFIYCVNGRRLRSGIYPPVTVLFRKNKGFYKPDGHAHRVVIDGHVSALDAAILHDDRKPLNRWFESQKCYSEIEAHKLLTTEPKLLNWKDRMRRWGVVAPPAMFVYCLLIRGGVLDGWAGFYYAFQRTFAELMLSLRLIELSGSNRVKK